MNGEKAAAGDLVDQVLDDSYRIEQLLGEGGMGAVYVATQIRLEKPVAVKVMARELTSNPEALERFRREARITSALGHPHIVQVFDFSSTRAGEPFFVMEYLEGEDLEKRLRRVGRLPLGEVVLIVKQVASALSATHAKGIVHRDLKPGNIFLVEATGVETFAKVLDFGISKIRTSSTKLTRTSSIMGTPNYMSPEQAKGKIDEIDEGVDQWALACIAWECLTGACPFTGENVPSILFQIVHEPLPPLGAKVAGLPPHVEQVLARALTKDRAGRFPGVAEFAAALEGASMARDFEPSSVGQRAEPHRTERPEIPNTTFSRTAGAMEDNLDVPTSFSKKSSWALATGAVAVVLLLGFVLLRPSPAGRTATLGPPASVIPPPPTAAAEPSVLPTPDAGVAGRAEMAPEKPAISPAGVSFTPETKGPESRPAVRSAKKRVPAKQPEEEIWH